MPIHRHVQRELDDSSDEEIETLEHAGIRRNQVRNYNGRPDLGHFGGDYEYQLKMEFPTFNGQLHIEEFLDWLNEIERFFDYMKIPDDKKVKLVAYKLKGGSSTWWEQEQISRVRMGKTQIRSCGR